MTQYTDVLARVPPGKLGSAEVVHDTPSEVARIRAMIQGLPLLLPRYARLLVDGRVVMTDAEFERDTSAPVVGRVRKGDSVLVAGLGLGLVLDPILGKARSVTVVEKNADVIALVGPSFPAAGIVRADIFEWLPPPRTKFDVAYFDIWPDIDPDDAKEARALERRFREYLKPGGWAGSWTTAALRALKHGPRRR
jgi:spermidine synthase